MSNGINESTMKNVFQIAGILAPISGMLYIIVIYYLTDLLHSTERVIIIMPGLFQIVLGVVLLYMGKYWMND
ncbi:MAG: hypothetical protein ACOC40_01235 [Thermoplasmatota archaeon]